MSSEAPPKVLHIALWVLQGLLAFAFLGAGVMKLVTSQADLVAGGAAWAGRVPEALIPLIGVSEVLGAVGLILPAMLGIMPKLTPLAAIGLFIVMALAAIEHGMNWELGGAVPSLVLAWLCMFVAWGRLFTAPTLPR